jgi:virginiamycin B lyase
MRNLLLLVAAAVAAAIVVAAASAAEAPICTSSCITEYPAPIPVVYNGPFGIAKGLGDDMWFGDQDTIDRIDRDGNTTTYTVPSPGAAVGWVTEGPDGSMWFAERGTDKIGRVDNVGNITEYQIPTPNSVPQAIVVSDGIVWFTEQAGNKIGRLDPTTGNITEYAIPVPSSAPLGLALGSDDALWFTQQDSGGFAAIGRMTKNGVFTEYPLNPIARPQRIVAGADGALWFTEAVTSKIGRITTDGQLTEYPLAPGSRPVGITTVPGDQAVWFVESGSNAIVRMNLDGTVTNQWTNPSPNSQSLQIAAGSNRMLWFTESFLSPTGNKVGRLDPYASG